MIVCKPDYTPLEWKDIESNCNLKPYHKFSVAYCVNNFNIDVKKDKLSPLGFTAFGSEVEAFKDFVLHLNEQDYAALIFISAEENYHEFPIFFGKNNDFALACTSFDDCNFEESVEKFSFLSQMCKNPTSEFVWWMMDEISNSKDTIAVLDNKCSFHFLNTHHRYDDNGITYCIKGKPSKYSSNAFSYMLPECYRNHLFKK